MRFIYFFSLFIFSIGSSAQIFAPGSTPSLGSSLNSNVGIGTNQPMGNFHIRGRDGIGIVLDMGHSTQMGSGMTSSMTSYPLEIWWTDNTVWPASVNALKARFHNSGRLDLGTNFSSRPVNASSRLNVLNSTSVQNKFLGELI